MNKEAPNRFVSMAKMKCPNCQKGNMFKNKSVLPLKKLLDMPERCTVCGQKFELEVGFWYGTGYVSYAMCVALMFIMAIVFALTVGFTWRNNSIFIFITIMVVAIILLQPWIMRYARVLYLYVFVKKGRGQTISSE